jgi:heat shock protein HspQ
MPGTEGAVLVRSLMLALREVSRGPRLWQAVRAGVVRRNDASHSLSRLQERIAEVSAAQHIRQGLRRDDGDALAAGYNALRAVAVLRDELRTLHATGAFLPLTRRSDGASSGAVEFMIGQHVDHSVFARGVVYGWDLCCNATELPPDGAESTATDCIVDNRLLFAGIDGVPGEPERAQFQQPFYRVLFADGSARYCSQSNLRAVRRDDCLRLPIRGSSFFFAAVDPLSGCLLPNADLRDRYPDDDEGRRARTLCNTL